MFGNSTFSQAPFSGLSDLVSVVNSLSIQWDVSREFILLTLIVYLTLESDFDLNVTTQKELEVLR